MKRIVVAVLFLIPLGGCGLLDSPPEESTVPVTDVIEDHDAHCVMAGYRWNAEKKECVFHEKHYQPDICGSPDCFDTRYEDFEEEWSADS